MAKTKDLYLSRDRYLAALKRIRGLIAGGRPLASADCVVPGMKSTECSWGLCADDKEAWPDPNDYLWPDQPDRVAPKYLNGQRCPLDKRAPAEMTLNGCFYTCRHFRPGKRQTSVGRNDRAFVIRLYDEQIAHTEQQLP